MDLQVLTKACDKIDDWKCVHFFMFETKRKENLIIKEDEVICGVKIKNEEKKLQNLYQNN